MYDDQVTGATRRARADGGARGYGPTHTRSRSRSSCSGSRTSCVVAASECHDVGALLTAAVEDERRCSSSRTSSSTGERSAGPTTATSASSPSARAGDPYPALTFSATDFTEARRRSSTYGGMVPIVLDAVTELVLEHEIFCEVVALSQLVPMELDAVLESVARTGALVTAEEGNAHRRVRCRDRGAGPGGGLERPACAGTADRGSRRDHPVGSAARGRDAPERRRRRRGRHGARGREVVLEIVLTREDANTEYALVAEWLVEDRSGGDRRTAGLRRRDDEGDR